MIDELVPSAPRISCDSDTTVIRQPRERETFGDNPLTFLALDHAVPLGAASAWLRFQQNSNSPGFSSRQCRHRFEVTSS
jgi:hypothetical protein